MASVLITAFEPYGAWNENASWLCLQELLRDYPEQPAVTTRRYPVDFVQVRERLEQDLAAGFDLALHLGQSPGSGTIQLETIGLNVGGEAEQKPEEFGILCDDGPAAYRTSLPLADWATMLREAGIPARVSYHAGTYLCNATLYLTHYLSEQMGLATRAAFIHLPLEVSQVVSSSADNASLPASTTARAVRLILDHL